MDRGREYYIHGARILCRQHHRHGKRLPHSLYNRHEEKYLYREYLKDGCKLLHESLTAEIKQVRKIYTIIFRHPGILFQAKTHIVIFSDLFPFCG
jgi:hypothetical protein